MSTQSPDTRMDASNYDMSAPPCTSRALCVSPNLGSDEPMTGRHMNGPARPVTRQLRDPSASSRAGPCCSGKYQSSIAKAPCLCFTVRGAVTWGSARLVYTGLDPDTRPRGGRGPPVVMHTAFSGEVLLY
ncbi:hypothetical protein M3J09_007168 [Ascochyta lentis]